MPQHIACSQRRYNGHLYSCLIFYKTAKAKHKTTLEKFKISHPYIIRLIPHDSASSLVSFSTLPSTLHFAFANNVLSSTRPPFFLSRSLSISLPVCRLPRFGIDYNTQRFLCARYFYIFYQCLSILNDNRCCCPSSKPLELTPHHVRLARALTHPRSYILACWLWKFALKSVSPFMYVYECVIGKFRIIVHRFLCCVLLASWCVCKCWRVFVYKIFIYFRIQFACRYRRRASSDKRTNG